MANSFAYLNGQMVTGLEEITDDLSRVHLGGRWILVGFFEGPVLAFKFTNWITSPAPSGKWFGTDSWTSNTNRSKYLELVASAQQAISQGDFYQVNVCHQYQTKWDDRNQIAGLFAQLVDKYSAKYSALIHIEDPLLKNYNLDEIKIASVSPELFLSVNNQEIKSSPIKGTVPKGADFLDKDEAENIMIVDLVRNDLAQVCKTASVTVPKLLERVELPNLDHLVSTVSGELKSDVSWQEIIAATFPPGSVTGAPKSSALKFIMNNEPPREIYCGTIGWINSDERKAELSVAIRTFWKSGDYLKFGAGAGITWGSEATQEWLETELKAMRLIEIASEPLREES